MPLPREHSLWVRPDPPDEFGGSYESECAAGGRYGALKTVDATHSRRAFLAGLAAVVSAPALIRCSSDKSSIESPVGSDAARRRVRPALPETEPLMRVRVLRTGGPGAQTLVGAATQWLAFETAATAGTETVLRGPVVVRVGTQGWSVTDANGLPAPIEAFEPFEIASLSTGDPDIAVGKRIYPGRLRLVARGDTAPDGFDVINLVPMEAYLPGVVAGELFSHWLPETHAAQVIAARSFATSEHAWSRGRREWDVTGTAHSQVYRGRVDHTRSHEAVEATRGVVLGYGGYLVPGYYSSCCGGTAASALDAIGGNPVNDVPPLVGRTGEDVCTDAKVARWTIDRPLEDLTRRFAAWGRRRGRQDIANLGEVASIEVVQQNEHGRPTHYTVTDTAANTVKLRAGHLRAAANFSGASLQAPTQRLWSSHVSVTVTKNTAGFAGRGFGHGVGMCQYGAESLARAGTNHENILEWYYPGVDIIKAY